MGVPVRGYLKKRRDRALGSILGWSERNGVPEAMGKAKWDAFRENVLAAINGYHDAVLDLVSAEEGVVRNDHLVNVLEAVEQELQRTRRGASVHSAP